MKVVPHKRQAGDLQDFNLAAANAMEPCLPKINYNSVSEDWFHFPDAHWMK